MADNEKIKVEKQKAEKPTKSASQDKKPSPKSINVTKPREQKSVIDASRVSAHTLREQQALEKLKKQIGNLDQKESRAGQIKTIIAIVLVAVLIALAILFLLIIRNGTTSEEESYDIRVSMQIENKSTLSVVTDSGKQVLRKIFPGEKVPLSAYVRNSNEYEGDAYNPDEFMPRNIYIRFKIVFVLDYEERNDIIIPTMSNMWYSFNEEDESKFPDGILESDGYYYYLDSLPFTARAELFSSIKFDGNKVFYEDGGKFGQIQVIVESIEADINNITSESLWPTAPKHWIVQMIKKSNGE